MLTGWRRLIGCPHLQTIFHKRATKYSSLLRKMTYEQRDPMSLRHPVINTTYISMYPLSKRVEWVGGWIESGHVSVQGPSFVRHDSMHSLFFLSFFLSLFLSLKWRPPYPFFMSRIWLVYMWEMTHPYVGHDSSICGTWLIHIWDIINSPVRHDSFLYSTRLMNMCDMTYSHMWHDSFICATWHTHTCDMTHSYVRHDIFTHVTW